MAHSGSALTMELEKSNLTRNILIGLALGALAGVIIGQFVDFQLDATGELMRDGNNRPMMAPGFLEDYVVGGLLEFLGAVFIRGLQFIVVPLVFVSLVCGTASMNDARKLGSVGLKSVGLYLLTTCLAITIAIVLALVVKPGAGLEVVDAPAYEASASRGISEILTDIVPSNLFGSFVEGNMLQVIFAAILIGIAMLLSGGPGQRLLAIFGDANDVIMKMVGIIMLYAPIGVFAKICQVFATEGFATILALGKYFALVAVVLVIHGAIVYPAMLKIFAGLNPVTFFRKMRAVQVFAFGTASSNATLPVTLRTVEEKLGAHNNVASFTVPLGATINMDGTAIMQGVATVFIAQFAGVDLSLGQILMVIFTATLASIGTAGVPSVGLVMLVLVLNQVDLPVQHIGLIIGVDRLLDMLRTAVNVTGDAAVTCIVAKSEGQLDEAVYASADA